MDTEVAKPRLVSPYNFPPLNRSDVAAGTSTVQWLIQKTLKLIQEGEDLYSLVPSSSYPPPPSRLQRPTHLADCAEGIVSLFIGEEAAEIVTESAPQHFPMLL
jgi:hypothetical protein